MIYNLDTNHYAFWMHKLPLIGYAYDGNAQRQRALYLLPEKPTEQ